MKKSLEIAKKNAKDYSLGSSQGFPYYVIDKKGQTAKCYCDVYQMMEEIRYHGYHLECAYVDGVEYQLKGDEYLDFLGKAKIHFVTSILGCSEDAARLAILDENAYIFINGDDYRIESIMTVTTNINVIIYKNNSQFRRHVFY